MLDPNRMAEELAGVEQSLIAALEEQATQRMGPMVLQRLASIDAQISQLYVLINQVLIAVNQPRVHRPVRGPAGELLYAVSEPTTQEDR